MIWSICAQNLEFQKVNPTTQVALYSRSVDQSPTIQNITWNIYHGIINSTRNYTRWTPFNKMDDYNNIWFYGRNTTNFTATNDLFRHYPNETHWKFEVVYSFGSITSSSALNFEINPPPSNGLCHISPSNGTTTTVFTITCSNWSNQDNIKDYSLYSMSNISSRSKLTIIAFSPVSSFEVRLPPGNNLKLMVHIRDTLDCIAEYNLSSVHVLADSTMNLELINLFRQSSDDVKNSILVQLLSSGNQNMIGQLITSFTEEFNQMNHQMIYKAVSNGVPLTSISISSLGSQRLPQVMKFNQSGLIEFNKEINSQADLREYLIQFTTKLSIISSNSLKLQSLSLVQLTNATNQLTRTTLVSNNVSLFSTNK